MPVFYYKCSQCEENTTLFHKKDDKSVCKKCGSNKLERNATGASSQVLETLDNGLMARKVERAPDIEKIMKERSSIDIKRKFEL
jgi:putative FmdB family regulatory protein